MVGTARRARLCPRYRAGDAWATTGSGFRAIASAISAATMHSVPAAKNAGNYGALN